MGLHQAHFFKTRHLGLGRLPYLLENLAKGAVLTMVNPLALPPFIPPLPLPTMTPILINRVPCLRHSHIIDGTQIFEEKKLSLSEFVSLSTPFIWVLSWVGNIPSGGSGSYLGWVISQVAVLAPLILETLCSKWRDIFHSPYAFLSLHLFYFILSFAPLLPFIIFFLLSSLFSVHILSF